MNNFQNPDKDYQKEQEKRKYLIKRLFDNVFATDKEWNSWFFNNVYKDDEALSLDVDGRPVSCLFLQHYDFLFHGKEVGLAYMAGAATDYKMRHHGYMGQLIRESLVLAYHRGETFVGLIPAERRLFFFYDKFQFATVVLADIQRFTSLHSFPADEDFVVTEPTFEGLRILERQRNATVLHTESQFLNILADIDHDKGAYTQINDLEGNPLAMAFATSTDSEIHVKELLGVNPRANDMALGAVRSKLNLELPMAVWRLPTGRQASLRSRGMIRIVNVSSALETLAKAHPALERTIRTTDPLIPENNGVFRISKGTCRYLGPEIETGAKIDLDVNIETLCKILFSGASMGNIMGLPSSHPAMPLMLD